MITETWNVKKHVRRTGKAIIATQHTHASEAGKKILEAGGNAVDASIAAAFAIGVLEPWQSGLGGVGKMIVKLAEECQASIIEFPAKSFNSINPSDYQLEGDGTSGMFKWPKVKNDSNIIGERSICVPGLVKGMGHAYEKYSSISWAELLKPAITLSEKPLYVDPVSSCKLLSITDGIDKYPEIRNTYFKNNLPPVTNWLGEVPLIFNTSLTATLKRLAKNGASDFYNGELSKSILDDCRAQGVHLDESDLNQYEVYEVLSKPIKLGDDSLIYSSETPFTNRSMRKVFHELSYVEKDTKSGLCYKSSLYKRFVDSLLDTENESNKSNSCTTHISCIDDKGNAVSLTITLLSLFGSRIMLRDTGIVMNNGMMWFNPVPGNHNSIGRAKIPPNNMYPTIMTKGNNKILALGASGGRRILPCVAQLVFQRALLGVNAEKLLEEPRVDVDVDGAIVYEFEGKYQIDIEALFSGYYLKPVVNSINPNFFACPNLVEKDVFTGECVGSAFPNSPVAAASGI